MLLVFSIKRGEARLKFEEKLHLYYINESLHIA
jgi:hypothetical protein